MTTNDTVQNSDDILTDIEVLDCLLHDKTTNENIIWASNDYEHMGRCYGFKSPITSFSIIKNNECIIKSRADKDKSVQLLRSKEKAEVFTPSWICNKQNNLIDNAWFERENVFNTETENGWTVNNDKIIFPFDKTWEDYVKSNRLEITCGEAPYLTSRYDTVSGKTIPVNERIGFLDRKLRIISENTSSESDWLNWAEIAIKSIYGYDWQGDNVFLARKNLLFTFCEHYNYKFNKNLNKSQILKTADILAWNIWQMDGLKFVIPQSCHNQTVTLYTLLGEEKCEDFCEGCKKNSRKKHNGTYCYIMNWETNKKIKFVNMLNRRS